TGATPAVQAQNAATGTDTIVVAGKGLNCKTFEVETDSAGSKVKTKTWTSEQIPGFLVKSGSTSSGATTSTSTMQAVDFNTNYSRARLAALRSDGDRSGVRGGRGERAEARSRRRRTRPAGRSGNVLRKVRRFTWLC